ncbi:MAG: 3-deoxy-7-phosphoheptulonate synthase [Planctomycetes bacterium]|nr:3-deoxy-7-phosphoheptulonate synthase [Planctomycetota bacterium]
MIAVLKPSVSLRDKAQLVSLIEARGLRVHLDKSGGEEWVGVLGEELPGFARELAAHPAVAEIRATSVPYALASRAYRAESSVVRVGSFVFGGAEAIVMAGPCAVENEAQIFATARAVAAAGARILRGGAFKPRTSPYSFQGLGEEGLELMAAAGRAHGLPIVTEVVAPEDVALVAKHADVLQIGARNMQNFRLLSAVGECERPVLLKRGLVATLEELLLAAEYVLAAGNPDVILCERGIRTFVRETRNTLDLAAIPLLKQKSHLPVVADPSHGTGVRALVPPLAKAALAAGADGLLIEVHPDPATALSDGPQSLTFAGFAQLMDELRVLAPALGREMHRVRP